jgi:hypothetical protein
MGLAMNGQILAATVILLATSTVARATNVYLNLTTTTDATGTSGTWTVTATLGDNQTLGIASFSLEVDGIPDAGVGSTVTALKASGTNSNTPPTLIAPNPPYSVFRNNGIATAPKVSGIAASQDTVTAATTNDPTVLRFGDGLTTKANSSVYGSIQAGGALTLATGRWTATGTGGSLQAIVTPGSFFNLYPLNYAVDDGTGTNSPPPAGTTTAVVAGNVIPSSVIPEPASLALMAFGGLALVAYAARRRAV